MVEVFATNVQEVAKANRLVAVLERHLPGCRINFDLEDCDRILRVEGPIFNTSQVLQLVAKNGVKCCVLE
ncbi:hypothetical protein FOA19_11335 [Rufibacter hautae]|uniref:HMA domain-containing protein n=2 Tax=Rufibacter hautae TaxID=2595005 RepID=A0A5B6THW8_9BACT|nr:hypothetical protein FOA19_11335 [Rufibacter hautae]